MKKNFLLFFLFLLILRTGFALGFVYDVNLINNNGTLIFEKMGVEDLKIPLDNSLFGDHTFEVLSYSGEKLYLGTFETKGYAIFEGDLGEGFFDSKYVSYNFSKINFKASYYENASSIVIYDESLNEVLEIDVSMYSKNIPNEEKKDSPVTNQTKIKNDSKKVSEKDVSQTKSLEEKLAEKWWILAIILIILLIILIKPSSSIKNSKKHLYN